MDALVTFDDLDDPPVDEVVTPRRRTVGPSSSSGASSNAFATPSSAVSVATGGIDYVVRHLQKESLFFSVMIRDRFVVGPSVGSMEVLSVANPRTTATLKLISQVRFF